MKPVLLTDFGSTYTKLTAVDVDTARVLGTAAAYTTVQTDVNDGFSAALRQLEEKTGRLEYAERYACSSAAGGLRMIPSHIQLLPCTLLILFFLLLAAALDRGGDRLVVEVLLALLALLLGRLLAGAQAGLDGVVVAGGLLFGGLSGRGLFLFLRELFRLAPDRSSR